MARKGYQVKTSTDVLGPGVGNSDTVCLAKQSGEIIVTFDADFLRLTSYLQRKVKAIYIDLYPRDPREGERLLEKWVEKCIAMLAETGVAKPTSNGPVAKRESQPE